MRVSYLPPTTSQFDVVFSSHPVSVRGGGLSDINVLKPEYYHRGGSLFGILGSIVKKTIPFLSNYILPEAKNFARNVASDMDQKLPFKKTIRKNLIKSAKNVGKRVMYGGGKKTNKQKKSRNNNKKYKKKKVVRKRKSNKCHIKPNDIFSNDNLNF